MFNVLYFWYSMFLLMNLSTAKILQGQLLTSENWAFLARFCFRSEEGRFYYEFVIGGEKSNVNLLFYYDTLNQWPSVYPSNKSCLEKQKILREDRGQRIQLSANSDLSQNSGCFKTDITGSNLLCRSSRKFRSSRPRWWFVALADCSSATGLNVTYRLSMTNAQPGNFWKEHFSADEFYILPELIAAACAHTILLILSAYVASQLRSRKLLHVTYKLFMGSVVCQLLGILLECSSYTSRALQGVDARRALLIGNLLECYAETLYTLLLLLLALGFTVTKSMLVPRHVMRLVFFVCISATLQLSLFIYESEMFDPGLVLYLYESLPGYGLISLRLLAWVVFSTCCVRTSRKHETKLGFYVALLSLGSAWFLCHPLMVLGCTLLVDKWVRESVVKGCSLWVILLGHSAFLYVTRPVANNTWFPFHIRTGQVLPVGGEGQGHSYHPHVQPPITLFIVPRLPSAVPTPSR